MTTDLSDRMKLYESTGELPMLPLLPVMARLDGKCFHNFTRGLKRPYDKRLTDLMVETTKFLVSESNARIGYTQSDEISLVLFSNDLNTELFMGGRHFKLVSILASMATLYFNQKLEEFLPEKKGTFPLFDCRVWTVPNKTEAVNTILWRELDATRNSISMAAQSQFSHSQLMHKSCDEMQEMLFQEKQINWNDYPNFFKRGTYIQRRRVLKQFSVEELEKLPPLHEARKNPNLMIERAEVKTIDMPVMTKVINREGVIFDGEEPIVAIEPELNGEKINEKR